MSSPTQAIVFGFVAVDAPGSSSMSAATPSSAAPERASTTSSVATQTSDDIYVGGVCIGSFADLFAGRGVRVGVVVNNIVPQTAAAPARERLVSEKAPTEASNASTSVAPTSYAPIFKKPVGQETSVQGPIASATPASISKTDQKDFCEGPHELTPLAPISHELVDQMVSMESSNPLTSTASTSKVLASKKTGTNVSDAFTLSTSISEDTIDQKAAVEGSHPSISSTSDYEVLVTKNSPAVASYTPTASTSVSEDTIDQKAYVEGSRASTSSVNDHKEFVGEQTPIQDSHDPTSPASIAAKESVELEIPIEASDAPISSTSTTQTSTSDDIQATEAQTEIMRAVAAIQVHDYFPDLSLLELVQLVEDCDIAIERWEEWGEDTYEDHTVLEWHVRRQEYLFSLAIREQETEQYNNDPKIRLAQLFPAKVVRAKNATDPSISEDLQPPPAPSDPATELQDALYGWRDTVDNGATDYESASSGEHWWKYMEHEDFDGIDNNQYHDYYPDIPRKAVYHNTAVQTRILTGPMERKKVYGRAPTKAEARKLSRYIGSPEYVDHSELHYGKPFLDPYGPYADVQTETQDSGFQTMDCEFREANVLKAEAKAQNVAIRLNQDCKLRKNGLRVFAEPSTKKLVHSAQFSTTTLIDKNGMVVTRGGFAPTIQNVLYEHIAEAQVAIPAKSSPVVSLPTPESSPEPTTPTMRPEAIPSHCQSPLAGPFEGTQEDLWPTSQFPLSKTDGTFSMNIERDFAVPITAHSEQMRSPAAQMAPSVPAPGATVPASKTKRRMEEFRDEGAKRLKSGVVPATASIFSTQYDTPLSAGDVKLASKKTDTTKKRRGEPAEPAEPKRLRKEPVPVRRRLPPAESTLRVIDPKGASKPVVPQAPLEALAKPEKGESTGKQVEKSATAPSQPKRWAERKPSSREGKKENPDRWRVGFGLSRRT